MPFRNPLTVKKSKVPPPNETGQEAQYLKALSEKQTVVSIKLTGGEVVRGWIEYFDQDMIRLTREGSPNLFIYKHDIISIAEEGGRGRNSQ
jgi:host factor-I protein